VFQNISHSFGSQEVLKDISFEIELNKVTVIIGKSGSGKSTILQIINGLVKPTSGKAIVFGNELDFSNIEETRLNIGYAVQGTGLFPHMSVYENIGLLGVIKKWRKHEIERRTDQLMSLVDLPPSYKTKYPHQLSGGEQQRTGLCRSMFLNPPLFLLDEPFGALDPMTRKDIHSEVMKVQNIELRTIVMVTHDMHEALKLGDKIMVIDKGEIVQFDDKEIIVKQPKNEAVRNLLV